MCKVTTTIPQYFAFSRLLSQVSVAQLGLSGAYSTE